MKVDFEKVRFWKMYLGTHPLLALRLSRLETQDFFEMGNRVSRCVTKAGYNCVN